MAAGPAAAEAGLEWNQEPGLGLGLEPRRSPNWLEQLPQRLLALTEPGTFRSIFSRVTEQGQQGVALTTAGNWLSS